MQGEKPKEDGACFDRDFGPVKRTYLNASMYALIVFTSIPHSVARLLSSSGS
jgi:hypothetical protein